MPVLGIDTGGTFTDFVLLDERGLRVHKVLSTPEAPERAILTGIRELGLDAAKLRVVHGSTVATNAVLEGKGVRTLYVGNRGLEDLLTIGRQARAHLYDLQPPPAPVPVPARLCLGTGGRLGADGARVEPLTEADLDALAAAIGELKPRALAVNHLFSYLDDAAERAIERAALAADPTLFVARSSEVLPLIGEYERGIATWINAWVGPLVARYLDRLGDGLPGARVAVMQSSGEAVAARQTARQAVRLLLSGPAGGLVGAAAVGRSVGCERLLTFDMGGTSTDVALIDGEARLTSEGRVAGWPVAVPMVDMHTIGAGGGSIARIDAGGALLVGPESAGAAPGPACYGRGGRQPTVTDANLVLGRLVPEAFLGGRMRLDVQAAHGALARLGAAMGICAEEAALGVVAVANEHMAQALRVISVQRGLDPREFRLTAFGGAGALHVCALAEAMGMERALVPARSGVLSALGMLAAAPGRVLSRTWPGLLAELDRAAVDAALDALAARARAELKDEGVDPAKLVRDDSLDLRYRGQSTTLNLPWNGLASTARAFHAVHRARYGHAHSAPVELVNLRVRLRAATRVLPLGPSSDVERGSAEREQAAYGCSRPVPVIGRARMSTDEVRDGPALIVDPVATTWLAAGWRARLDEAGGLDLSRVPSP